MYSYCYVNGSKVYQEICAIEEKKDYYVFIDYRKHDMLIIAVYDESLVKLGEFNMTPASHYLFGWKLFTYFGGVKPTRRRRQFQPGL